MAKRPENDQNRSAASSEPSVDRADASEQPVSGSCGEAGLEQAPAPNPGRRADKGRDARVSIGLALLVLAVFGAGLWVSSEVRERRIHVQAVTQWMTATVVDATANDWDLSSLEWCQVQMRNEEETRTCEPAPDTLGDQRPSLRLVPGARLVVTSRGNARFDITVLPPPTEGAGPSDEAASGGLWQLQVVGLDGALLEATAEPVYLSADRNGAAINTSLSFYGVVEVGQVAGQAAGMLLHGEVSVVGRPLLGPRYTAYSEILEPGDAVRLMADDAGAAAGFAAVYFNPDLSADGLSVLVQSRAQRARISRFGGTDREMRMNRIQFMLANPVALYLSAIGVLIITLAGALEIVERLRGNQVGGSGGRTPSTLGKRASLLFGRGRLFSTLLLSSVAVSLIFVPVDKTNARPGQGLLTVFEQGQAVLIQHEGACLAIAPLHVLDGDVSAYVTPEGSSGQRYPGFLLHELPFDIAVLEVPGVAASECGRRLRDHARDVGRAPRMQDGLQLRMVTEGGDVRSFPVRTEILHGTRLLIRPAGDFALTTGMSGSVIVAGGEELAVLLRVLDNGIGEALRLDYVAYWITPLLRAAASGAQPAVIRDGNVDEVAIRLEYVSARPVRDGSPAQILFAPDEQIGVWLAAQPDYPVTLEVALGDGNPVDLGCVLVDLQGVDDTTVKPRHVELFVSGSSDGQNYRTLSHGSIPQEVEIWAIRLNVPARAQRLLFRVHSNWGEPDNLGIRRIRAYAGPPTPKCETRIRPRD